MSRPPLWHDRYRIATKAALAVQNVAICTIEDSLKGLAVIEGVIKELRDRETLTRLEDIVLEALREHEDDLRS